MRGDAVFPAAFAVAVCLAGLVIDGSPLWALAVAIWSVALRREIE